MNRARRTLISALVLELEGIRSRVEALQDIEQEAFDGIPPSLQQKEKGRLVEWAAVNLGTAAENLTFTIDNLIQASK